MDDLIVPQEFQKASVKRGKIATEKFFIKGRKIHQEEIRYKLLHKYKKHMRLSTHKMSNNLTKANMTTLLKNIGEYVNDDKEAKANILKKK